MTDTNSLARSTGAAAVVAGICYLPLGLFDGWQSIAAIASPVWWLTLGLAMAHHLFLAFALIGILTVALRRPGFFDNGAFVLATAGNLFVTGIVVVQLTVLPALASHPAGAAALDCTPFYRAATAAGRSLIAAACEPWHFAALEIWFGAGWLTLIAGSIALAIAIWRGAALSKAAAALLGTGWAVALASFALSLPPIVGRGAYCMIAAAWIWLGAGLVRAARP